jgi:CubicO group peptidase (beta-lactamase class C family)
MNKLLSLKHQKSMLNIVIILGFILVNIGVTVAKPALQTPTSDTLNELDKFIQAYTQENNIPGTVVALALKGELIHFKAYGLANVELSVPVSEKTVFEIGSISKQFTSAAALLLVEENTLDLDAPIHQYLPFLPGEWLGVTVHQLLNHTSGIPDYEEIRSYDIYRHRVTPEDIIKIAQSRPVDFAPGTGWYYSNTGYFLLSMIIERIEGLPFGRVLKKRIFDPLQMTDTRMADPETIIPNRASGYWVNKTNNLININPTETSSTLGAGGLLTTATDLVKWDKALYGENLLSSKTKALMWREVAVPVGENPHYGYGWELSDYKGLKATHHGGQVAGFIANFIRLTDHELTIIVLVNRYRVRTSPMLEKITNTFISGLETLKK